LLLSQIAKELRLKKISAADSEEKFVRGVYVADLLSLVLANARHNDLWLTHQGHQNIVALASLLELSCVVIAGGMVCQEETVRMANAENIPLYISKLPIFELAGRLYTLGLKAGTHAETD